MPSADWAAALQVSGYEGCLRNDPVLLVARLYEDHAISLIRAAKLLLGDQASAEDVV